MRWVTFRDGDGERTGVLSGDAIHELRPGVSLLDLIGRRRGGTAGGRGAGAPVVAHRAPGSGDADGADSAAAVDS